MAKGCSRRRTLGTVITKLPDALIIEILSRLPPKSLCRCKSVSKHWHYLISHPDHRKKLPQTLAGFFFYTEDIGRSPKVARHFQNVDGGPQLVDPNFSFLPPEFERVRLVDGCNGLLLCSSQSPFCLVVCNPATESWVMVPDSGSVGEADTLALAFDRDISPIFHVFQFVRNEKFGLKFDVVGTKIYSSGTKEWSYKDSGWNYNAWIFHRRHVFHHGMMHYVTSSTILAVDTEGKKWRTIPLPDDTLCSEQLGYVGQSQGHLFYMSQRGFVSKASIWFLENYDTDEWTLKHRVTAAQLLNAGNQHVYTYQYMVISGHPDCSLIYFANLRENRLMAYYIGCNEAQKAQVCGSIGRGDFISAFPYVPLYQETLV